MDDFKRSVALLEECKVGLRRYQALSGKFALRLSDLSFDLKETWDIFFGSIGNARMHLESRKDTFWQKPFSDFDAAVGTLRIAVLMHEARKFDDHFGQSWASDEIIEQVEDTDPYIVDLFIWRRLPRVTDTAIDRFEKFIGHFAIYRDQSIARDRQSLRQWLQVTSQGFAFWGELEWQPIAKRILADLRPDMLREWNEAVRETGESDPILALAALKKKRGRPPKVITPKDLEDMETIENWEGLIRKEKKEGGIENPRVFAKEIADKSGLTNDRVKQLHDLRKGQKKKTKGGKQDAT